MRDIKLYWGTFRHCWGKISHFSNSIERFLCSQPHRLQNPFYMRKKAVQKLGVLNRISLLLNPEIKNLVLNAVIKSHFSYCPLILMFSSRRSNNLIRWIHERSLSSAYIDTRSAFQELLQRNRSVSIRHKNIQTLIIKVLKVVNNICPPIMKTFFDFRKQIQREKIPRNQTEKSEDCPIWSRNALYRTPQLWSHVPADLKSLFNVNLFKSKIKHLECTEYSCKLCRTYFKI